MVEQRVVKDENGKVTGYREVSSLLYIERTKREVAERKSKADMNKKADRYLRLWARWNHSNTGYGASPLAHGDNVRMPPRSKPPFGCDDEPDEVSAVTAILGKMSGLDQVNRRYAGILRSVYMEQQSNETIEGTISRMKLKISSRGFRRAKECFAHLLFK